MRKVRILLLTSALTLTGALSLIFASASTPSPPPAPIIESCSCASADGSCSASVSCISGCTAYCGNDNNCVAYCSGTSLELGAKFNFQSQSATYSQLVAEVSRVGGRQIEFSVAKPNEVFNVGFKQAKVWDALELLSEHGTVYVAGQDFERLKSLRRVLLYEGKVTYCVNNTRFRTVVNDLSALTGLRLRIAGGNPTVNVRLENATLKDIISGVSAQTGIKIVEVSADATGR